MTVVFIIAAILAVAAAVWFYMEREKTRRLRSRFGPEYDRVVQSEGGARRGEAILQDRQRRVERFQIRPLPAEDRELYVTNWRTIQENFVDDPHAAIGDADRLINQALRAQGYPMGDFDQKAADLSVEHPHVIENYRRAHVIALKDARDEASTEDLRQGLQCYGRLFEDVLGATSTVEHQEVRR